MTRVFAATTKCGRPEPIPGSEIPLNPSLTKRDSREFFRDGRVGWAQPTSCFRGDDNGHLRPQRSVALRGLEPNRQTPNPPQSPFAKEDSREFFRLRPSARPCETYSRVGLGCAHLPSWIPAFAGMTPSAKENAGPALRRSGVETSAIGHDEAWPSEGYFLASLGLISFSGMPASLLAMFFFSSMG
jgi:hypothetical protein